MLPIHRDEIPTLLYNPTKKDFFCQYANADNTPKEYILPSRQITTFPKYLADHIAKHLAKKIALENPTVMTKDGSVRIHHEERVKQELTKIYVTI